MKRFEGILTLAMLVLGGYIGYVNDITNTATANETLIIPRFTDVPRTKTGFDLNIDLNSNKVVVSQDENFSVNIQKKDSIIYVPSVVEKIVPYYVKVREMPKYMIPKSYTYSPSLEVEKLEKINLDRN